MTSQKKSTPKLDYGIILTLMLMVIVSLVVIYSAQSTGQYEVNFVLQQAVWYFIGAGVIAVVIQFDSDQLRKISWYVYGIGLLFLIILFLSPDTLALTRRVNGSPKLVFYSKSRGDSAFRAHENFYHFIIGKINGRPS